MLFGARAAMIAVEETLLLGAIIEPPDRTIRESRQGFKDPPGDRAAHASVSPRSLSHSLVSAR